jgi:hypothetical protein
MPVFGESGGLTEAANNHPHDQLVDGPRLLVTLWEPQSRPSLRWLREQTRRRTIPFIKLGRRVFFIPSKVRAALEVDHLVHAKA